MISRKLGISVLGGLSALLGIAAVMAQTGAFQPGEGTEVTSLQRLPASLDPLTSLPAWVTRPARASRLARPMRSAGSLPSPRSASRRPLRWKTHAQVASL